MRMCERKREGRECKLDVFQHIAYVQGLIAKVSSFFGCGRKNVAAWAGHLRNCNSKPCVEIGGVFFNVVQAKTGGGLSLKSSDVMLFRICSLNFPFIQTKQPLFHGKHV